jgi:hypothetical protein
MFGFPPHALPTDMSMLAPILIGQIRVGENDDPRNLRMQVTMMIYCLQIYLGRVHLIQDLDNVEKVHSGDTMSTIYL